MAQAAVFLVLLAVSRDVRATLENPLGNHCCIPHPVTELMIALGMVCVCAMAPRSAYSTAPQRAALQEGREVRGDRHGIQRRAAKCKRPGEFLLALTVTRWGRGGKVSITGIRHRCREADVVTVCFFTR